MSEIREALEAAYSAAAANDTPTAPETAEASETASPERATEATERDETGKVVKTEKPAAKALLRAKVASPAPSGLEPNDGGVPRVPDSGDTPSNTEAPSGSEPIKPPQSWKPAVRAKFAGLGRDIQAEIDRREREISTALQQDAGARKGWQSFQAAVAPFEAMIRAEGSEPIAAVQSLLQTAAALRTGPADHKIRLLAGIVEGYGIPKDKLVRALGFGTGAGQPDSEQGQTQAPADYRDSRVDQILGYLQQTQQQQSAAARAQAQRTVAEFAAGHEFYEDVRQDMADIIDVHSARGVELTLEQAYNKAIRANDDVWEAIQQQKAAKDAEKANASTQRAKLAAASVRNQPTAANGAAQSPDSIRDILEASYQSLSSR